MQCPKRVERSVENSTNTAYRNVQTHICHGKESIIYTDDKLEAAIKKTTDDLTTQSVRYIPSSMASLLSW